MNEQADEEVMKNVTRNQQGFTLLEIIVVLAVLGALAAMLTPVVFRYIDDANRTRAQNDVSAIAAAINQMYKDTGRYPFYANGQGALAYTSGTDAAFLTSDASCAVSLTDLATCDDAEPAVGSGITGWNFALKGASLASHLITNDIGTTDYAVTGPRAWKGPYLDAIPTLDPWGRSYLVNISQAAPGSATATYALSAGPNGTVETSGDATATSNPTVGGDDVVARVK